MGLQFYTKCINERFAFLTAALCRLLYMYQRYDTPCSLILRVSKKIP